jgi:hypothetical protein
MARKQPIGGWLLYYCISLYAGLVFSLLLLATTLSGGKRNRALNVPSNVQPGLCQGTSFRHFRRSTWWKRSVFERDLAAIWPRDEKDQLRREKTIWRKQKPWALTDYTLVNGGYDQVFKRSDVAVGASVGEQMYFQWRVGAMWNVCDWTNRERLNSLAKCHNQPSVLARPIGVWAAFQPWIPTGERSGLQTRTGATESVTLRDRTKSWQLFSNLKRRFALAARRIRKSDRSPLVARVTVINDLAGAFWNGNKPTGLQTSYNLLVREQQEPALCQAIMNSALIRQGIGDMNPVHKLWWIAPVKHRQGLIAADAHNSFPINESLFHLRTLPVLDVVAWQSRRGKEGR